MMRLDPVRIHRSIILPCALSNEILGRNIQCEESFRGEGLALGLAELEKKMEFQVPI